MNVRTTILVIAASLGFAAPALAQNLVVNGDFSALNSGFTSGYSYSSPMYWQPAHYGFVDTDLGKSMSVDGAYSATQVVWEETLTVTPGRDYIFEAMAKTTQLTNPLVSLSFTANGVQLGTVALSNQSWQTFSKTWNSGTAGSVTLRIFDLQTNNSVPGNDFLIDNIKLTAVAAPVPEPETYGMMMAGLGMIGLIARRRKQNV